MNSDPHAAQLADDAFMNTLFEGHAEAAIAVTEMNMIAHQHRAGGFPRGELSARLVRTAKRLRAAANSLDKARDRGAVL